ERATPDIAQVESQLHFLWNVLGGVLVVPFVAMPAVKVPSGRQGSPASRFDQRESSHVSTQYLLDRRVQGGIKESLLQSQYILDHMTVGLRLLVPIEVVPAQPLQPCVEGLLHRLELLRSEQIRYADNSVPLEITDKLVDHWGILRSGQCI